MDFVRGALRLDCQKGFAKLTKDKCIKEYNEHKLILSIDTCSKCEEYEECMIIYLFGKDNSEKKIDSGS